MAVIVQSYYLKIRWLWSQFPPWQPSVDERQKLWVISCLWWQKHQSKEKYKWEEIYNQSLKNLQMVCLEIFVFSQVKVMEWQIGPGRLLGASWATTLLHSSSAHIYIFTQPTWLLTQTFFVDTYSTLHCTANPLKGSETVYCGLICQRSSDNLLSFNPMGNFTHIQRTLSTYCCPPGPWGMSQSHVFE